MFWIWAHLLHLYLLFLFLLLFQLFIFLCFRLVHLFYHLLVLFLHLVAEAGLLVSCEFRFVVFLAFLLLSALGQVSQKFVISLLVTELHQSLVAQLIGTLMLKIFVWAVGQHLNQLFIIILIQKAFLQRRIVRRLGFIRHSCVRFQSLGWVVLDNLHDRRGQLWPFRNLDWVLSFLVLLWENGVAAVLLATLILFPQIRQLMIRLLGWLMLLLWLASVLQI